ncbi:MAG: hypothetical protein HKP25_03615, partial [Marinicaulis sp.]|nr:hypothetical protein [Marinicaulis sp.]
LVGDAIFNLDDLGGDKQSLQFGRLASTQTFNVTVTTETGSESVDFMIDPMDTDEFGSIGELADYINTLINADNAAFADLVEVKALGSNRLVLDTIGGGVTEITINADASELGLVMGASVSPALAATADTIAPFFYGPADDATFTINFDIGGAPQIAQAVTISAAEAADNNSFFRLVNDVNRALNDAFGVGSNPFVANFDGNRLVINARAGFDVTDFSITADTVAAADDLKLAASLGGTTAADTADFLIFRLDGTVDRIDLSGAADIEDVIDAIHDQTGDASTDPMNVLFDGVRVTITDNGLSLQLVDEGAEVAGNAFRVISVHGSDAAFDLGLVVADQAAIADDADGPNAGTLDDANKTIIGDIISRKELAERLFLRRVDAATNIFSAGVEVRTLIADDPMTVDVFEGIAANFGFVGVEAETDGMQVLRADVGVNLRSGENFELLTIDPFDSDINQDGVLDVFDLAEILTFPSIDLPATTSILFDGDDATIVNVGGNVLNFDNHGFQTGERVVYSANGGTPIDGLDDGGTYYVFAFGPDILLLFDNADDALSVPTGTPLPINGLGAGAGHTLTVDNIIDMNIGVSGSLDDAFFGITGGGNPQVGLNVVTFGDPINLPDGALEPINPTGGGVSGDQIVFSGPHGFENGNTIVYRNGGGTDIGGLIDGETYYVVGVSGNMLSLAESEDGPAITLDITGSNGDGDNHRFQGFNPLAPDIQVVTSDLEDLLNFGEVDFDNILAILQQAAQFLEQFVSENADFLDTDIPVLGVSLTDLLDVAQGFLDAVEDIEVNRPASLQELTQRILESFGILPDPDEVAPPPPFMFDLVDDNDEGGAGMDGQTQDMLQVTFDFTRVFSEALDFNFDLGSVTGGAIGDDFFGDLISITGNTGLGASGGFFATLTLGVDLDEDASDETGVDADQFGEVFIFDHEDKSSLKAELNASSADVNFNASIGPIGASVIGGDAIFGAGIEFKNASVTDTDSRKSLFDDFSAAFSGFGAEFTEADSGKAIDLTLPIYIPTPSDYIGDIKFSADLEPDGSFTFTGPTFPEDLLNIDFLSQFDLFTSIPLMIDAIDLLLGTVQDVLQGEILGFELPFIEPDTFADAVQFIEDIRIDFIDPFITLFESTPKSGEELADLLQAFIFGLLGPGFDNPLADVDKQAFIDLFPELIALGDVFPAFDEGLGLLGDVDFNEFTTMGVEAFLAQFIPLDLEYEVPGDTSSDIVGVQWDFEFTGKVSPAINAGFDFGFPALGFEVDGGLALELTYGFGLGFGIALDKGAYIDIDSRSPGADGSVPDLELTLEAGFTPSSEITGRLGFLQLTATASDTDSEIPLNGDPAGANGIADDARLRASFAIDLVSSEAPDGRLAFFDLGSLEFNALVEAEADLNAMLRLGFNEGLTPGISSAVFPSLQADFEFGWSTGGELDLFDLGGFSFAEGLDSVAFRNIYLDIGSFLGDFLSPIVSQIQEITAPLQPIIDILTAPIPVVSDLAGQPISLVDIAAAFGEFDPRMIYAIADLITFVNSIPSIDDSAGAILLPIANDFILVGSGIFGDAKDKLTDTSFDIGEAISDGGEFADEFAMAAGDAISAISDLVGGDLFGDGGFNAGAFSSAFDMAGNSNPSSDAAKSAASGVLAGDFNSDGGGFAFPFLENPSSILGALIGQPIVLVTYDLPPFVVDFNWEQSFPIYPPLYALIGVGIGVKIDLAFGYDSLGVQEFIEGGAENPLDLLRGLYISDTINPDGSGADVPELQLFGSISVGAELNAGVAKAGVAADIVLTVNFDLNDPDGDGRVRIDELVGNFLYEFNYGSPALAPIAIFDVGGEISLQLRAFIEILLVIDLEFEITPPIVLFEFEIEFDREPFLATEKSGGTVLLNIGPNADSRQHGNTDDIAEIIHVRQDGDDVLVWSDQFNVSESNAQRYRGTHIIANGGDFADQIIFHDFDGTFEVIGGSGDDIVTLDADSSATGVIEGNDGDDMLMGGSGDETIIGGQGNDMITGGAGADLIFGDLGRVSERLISASVGAKDGEDNIGGGDGDDTIFGGGGSDQIGGDGKTSDGPDFDGMDHGDDLIFGDGGRIILAEVDDMGMLVPLATPEIRPSESFLDKPDTIHGHGADDTVYGGRGDDAIDGGADDDRLFGQEGFDLIEGGAGNDYISGGDNGDYLYGFREDLTVGNDADDGKDTIEGGDGGDFIRGNGDMDELFGQRGADIIFGDAGDDYIEGGSFNDTIFGGADSDTVEGGTGNDIVFGDDGLVVYFDFGTVPAASFFDENIARPGNIIGDADGDGIGITGVGGSTSDDRMIGDVAAPSLGSFVHDGVGNTLDLIYTAVKATDGDDFVNGGEGDDIIIGGAGDDEVFGDFVTFDPGEAPIPVGEDILFGDAGRVEFQKRLRDRIMSVVGPIAGNDTLSGNGGEDVLFGGGNDLGSGSMRDVLFGRHDSSVLPAGDVTRVDLADLEISDNDILIGDDGVIDYFFIQEDGGGAARVFSSVETIFTLLATDADLTEGVDPSLTGGGDDLFGSKDSDTLFGGFGADDISGDGPTDMGEDVAFGDNGQIDYRVEIATATGVFTPGDPGLGAADDDIDTVTSEIELVFTTDTSNTTGGDDTISGSALNDVIIGGAGGDELTGGDNDDIV